MGSFSGFDDTYADVMEFLQPLYGQDANYGHALLRGLQNFQLLTSFYNQIEASKPVSSDRSLKWADKEFVPSFYRRLQSVFDAVFSALEGSKLMAKPIHQVAPLKRVARAPAVSDEDEDEDEDEEEEVRPSKRAKLEQSKPRASRSSARSKP